MIKYFCDKCEKEITFNVYRTIEFKYRLTIETIVKTKHYCDKCYYEKLRELELK